MSDDDTAHRQWMRLQLEQAADHFGLAVVGEPVFGWHDRTIGSRTRDGRWLRVSWSQIQWTDGEWWTGNVDAAGIAGVPKPTVLDMHDWTVDNDGWGESRVRAEVMTLIEDPPCSATQELVAELDLPDAWWGDLRRALDTLAEVPTDRGDTDQEEVTNRLLAYFGDGFDPTVTRWTTAHNDLNWTNVTAPNLAILDWESWGRKIAGYDAASLYVLSLLAPGTAGKLHDTFADVLDSHDGKIAQLYAITRYLKRVEVGDFHNLAGALHRHARRVVASLGA
jgi:hypothetical protein